MGVYHRVPVRVMEMTLKKAFETFKNLHPDIKLCRRTFEMLRPKNIHLRKYAQRLQCCCTYHTNMDYVRKVCSNLFFLNGKESPMQSNDALISASLCDSKSLLCIFGVCSKCKRFPKIDELNIPSLKCSKSCLKENKDCSEHTVNVKQFERVTYTHKGEEKKKMKLLDKPVTPRQLATCFHF